MRKGNTIAVLVTGWATVAAPCLLAQDPAVPPSQPAPPARYDKSGAQPPQYPAPPPQASQEQKLTQLGGSSVSPAYHQASSIIGLEVRTDSGARLGKVQDLILSLDSERAPIAIIHSGGAFGLGGPRVAVSLKELKLSDDFKFFTMSATKDQLDAASTTPSGAWAAVGDQNWAKRVDRFYGQPTMLGMSRFERQEMEAGKQGRELVRNPLEDKGASALLNQTPAAEPSTKDPAAKPADSELATQVTALIEKAIGASAKQDIQVTVESGVVTLKGKIADAEAQQKLDEQIKAIPGVGRVDDQLTLPPKDK